MLPAVSHHKFLSNEAHALLHRLERVEPFVLHVPTVAAASVSPRAQSGIERTLAEGRRELQRLVNDYLAWLQGPEGRGMQPDEAQSRLSVLRLRFNMELSKFHIFEDALTQRSEHETGVWLAGLDAAAADALELSGRYYEAPPMICYLERGIGAAIRRARTRLPGGGETPVAIIQIPRERMIGSGIASSLIHEVGHQGSDLLGLVNSIKGVLKRLQGGKGFNPWTFWDRWISEILADFWSVSRLGIASTVGLIGVVGLPKVFVFQVDAEDPHPTSYLRVKLSCAMGRALYPDPQWDMLERIWESFYPKTGLKEGTRMTIDQLEAGIPQFIGLLCGHRPKSLRGKSLAEVFTRPECHPSGLRQIYNSWRTDPGRMQNLQPTLVFAAIGQAKFDGALGPKAEGDVLARMLKYWAMRGALDVSEKCAPLIAQRTAPYYGALTMTS